nr:hypothetical protein [Fluviispira multicolorata]
MNGQYGTLFDSHGVAAPVRSFADLCTFEDRLVEFGHFRGFVVRPDTSVYFGHGDEPPVF